MSKSLNKVFLMGHVGTIQELRETSSGTKIVNCTLATNYMVGEQERTDWHRLTFFGKLAQIAHDYVNSGDRLLVEGRVSYSSTGEGEDRKYYTDIIVNELTMLSGAPATSSAEEGEGERYAAEQEEISQKKASAKAPAKTPAKVKARR